MLLITCNRLNHLLLQFLHPKDRLTLLKHFCYINNCDRKILNSANHEKTDNTNRNIQNQVKLY